MSLEINIPTIRTCLEDLFAIYQNRIEEFPDLTPEAQSSNIERMKQQANYWNSLKELRVALKYLLEAKDSSVWDNFIYNWDDDFEEDAIKQVLYFALQTDWGNVGELSDDAHQNIQFVEMHPLQWREKNTLS
jgi:hypothetical protein